MRSKFIFGVFLFLVSTALVSAVDIYIDPSSQIVGEGDSFTVNVSIADAVDLYSYQFDLIYDPSILLVSAVDFGSFLSSDGGSVFEITGDNTTAGILKNHASTRASTTIGVNGNGVLTQVTFVAIAQGTANVGIVNELLYDSVPQELVHGVINGSVDSIDCDVDNDGQRSLVCGGVDCNDNDPLEFDGQTWYKDGDYDSYSDGTTQIICERPVGYNVTSELIATSGDCNDVDPAINPGATEICDGADNDCSAGTVDGSGEVAPTNTLQDGVCAASTQSCISGSWTDDYSGIATYEAGSELTCNDVLDNDCDVDVDFEDLDCVLSAYDLNNDGIVNIVDISISASSFGSACSVADNWCSRRDVDQNGLVNILDLSLIGLNFT